MKEQVQSRSMLRRKNENNESDKVKADLQLVCDAMQLNKSSSNNARAELEYERFTRITTNSGHFEAVQTLVTGATNARLDSIVSLNKSFVDSNV